MHHMNSSLEYIKQAIEIYQNDLYPDLLDVSYKNEIINELSDINDDLFAKIEEHLNFARSNVGIN